ncbi:uncharacterized protein LOC109594018 isoform X2 [Aethina tumida]|uniref:uncharacterized protein LOC109594018 isoform X2 n=1 Tax=Aethina tumida TaxID=116153 RepID=UPI00096AF18C|nr:uncharacterized protein LOC109594018 isoform X2 [Aethina tumida]
MEEMKLTWLKLGRHSYSVMWPVFVFLVFVLSYSSAQSVCPNGFVKLGRKCYHFGNGPETWLDAHHECVKRGSTLASIKNARQNNYISNFLIKNFGVEKRNFWIGGRFNYHQNIWVWGDSGEPLKIKLFTKTDHQKDLTFQCIYLTTNRKHEWNTKNCMDKNYYVCQKNSTRFNYKKCAYPYDLTKYESRLCSKKGYHVNETSFPGELKLYPRTPATSTQPTPTKISYACNLNTFMIGKKCYYFSKEPGTWHDAFFACKENGAKLAILRNKKHEFKIREFLTDQFVERWIGALYDNQSKKWNWFNGQHLTFRGFAPGALRNKDLEFTAAFMDPKLQYRWNVDKITSKRKYICQSNAKTVLSVGNYKKKKKLRKPDATITISTHGSDYNNTV